MRLKLEKLREARNRTGTAETTVTANIHTDSSVPSMFLCPKRVGTDTSIGWSSAFPAFPSGLNDREREISGVNAAIPAVPIATQIVGDPKSWENELLQWAKAHCVFSEKAWGNPRPG